MQDSEKHSFGWKKEQMTEGPLDVRYSQLLNKVLERIEKQTPLLVQESRALYQDLESKRKQLEAEGKKVVYTFLTSQGVPVSWLLAGLYDAHNQEMPESNVLGISKGAYNSTEVAFDPAHTEELKAILHIGQPDVVTVLIDDASSAGITRGTTYELIKMLGGVEENYLFKVLLKENSATVPWDWDPQRSDGDRFEPETAPTFISLHPYLAVNRSSLSDTPEWRKINPAKGIAEPPVPNTNPSSEISVNQIATKLYQIGRMAATVASDSFNT
jgi:hypothetical protein